MQAYRHSGGRAPCFKTAFYAPAAFIAPTDQEPAPFVRAGVDGWPRPVAPATLDDVRCGSCRALLHLGDVTARATTMPIILRADRRQLEAPAKNVALTRALLAHTADGPCMTAKQIAAFLGVDPRQVTAAMERGDISHAFRQGRRGGVGEWRCPWPDGRSYLLRQIARADDAA